MGNSNDTNSGGGGGGGGRNGGAGGGGGGGAGSGGGRGGDGGRPGQDGQNGQDGVNGGGGGGGGGGGAGGGRGGRGGRGSGDGKDVPETMAECKNTVIITGFGLNISEEDFIKHFRSIGKIIESDVKNTGSVRTVTYADSKTAERAVEKLDGKEIGGNVINVAHGDKFCYSDYIHHAEAGKRGQDGTESPHVPRGHYGEDSVQGDAGDRPAVTHLKLENVSHELNDGWQNNGNKSTRIARGGKGGVGGSNVPNGHDGEDGEPGPGGKGGAGGRPAISNSRTLGKGPYERRAGRSAEYKNPYEWNGNWGNFDNVPWYTRWFGTEGSKKKHLQDYNLFEGAKGGKGGEGYKNVPNGYDGEDGEVGPGGKGGAGGRPAFSNSNPYQWNGDWKGNMNNKNEWTGTAKGGKGGQGYKNVPSGHDGEDGEAGPGGKGGKGGRPAM